MNIVFALFLLLAFVTGAVGALAWQYIVYTRSERFLRDAASGVVSRIDKYADKVLPVILRRDGGIAVVDDLERRISALELDQPTQRREHHGTSPKADFDR
jgi:hypothetical protein